MKAGSAERITWTGHEAVLESARASLLDYLRDLGMRDPALVNALALECLNHARRRVGPGLRDELLRRAIEEVQRRMDVAVARWLGLNASRDAHTIAGARAALLMCRKVPSTDFLFDHPEPDPEFVSRLKAVLPMATPPESPRAMAPQKLDFFLFKSA